MTEVDITDRTEINVSIRDGFGSGYDGPNGLVKLNADGNLEAYVIHRQVTSAEISSIVLEDGEIAFTSDTHEIHLGDGVTPGGKLVSDEDYGAELLINGGFDTSLDGWSQTTAGKWNWSDGKAVAIIKSGFYNYLYQDVTVEANTWYILNYETDQPLYVACNGIAASYVWEDDTISNRPTVLKTGSSTTLRVYFRNTNTLSTSYVDSASLKKIASSEIVKRYKGLIVGSPIIDWTYAGGGSKASCRSPGLISDFIKSDEGYFDRLGVNTISSGTSDYVKIDITGPNGKSGALLVSERCYPDQWFPFYDRTLEDQPVVALMMAEGANGGNPGIFASTIDGNWHIGINSDYDDANDGYWLKVGGAVNFLGNVDIDGSISALNFSGSSSGTNTGDQDLSNFIEGPGVSLVNHLAVFNSTDGKEVRDEAVDVYWVSDVLNIDTETSNGSTGFSIKTQDGAESLKIKIDDVSDFVTFSLDDYNTSSTIFNSIINSFRHQLIIYSNDADNNIELHTHDGWSAILAHTNSIENASWEIGVIEDNVIGPTDLSIGTRNNVDLHIIRNNISVLDFDSDEIKSATSSFKGTGFYLYNDASGDFGSGLGLGGFTGLRIDTTETSEQSNICVADDIILEIKKNGVKSILHGELEATGFHLPAEQVGFFGGGYGNGITGVSVNGEEASEYVYIHLADNTSLRFIHDSTKDYAITGALDFNFIDNDKIILGTGLDSKIYYDGTNLIINPKAVGAGIAKFEGGVAIGTTMCNGVFTADNGQGYALEIREVIDEEEGICLSAVVDDDSANVPLEIRSSHVLLPSGDLEVWSTIKATGYKSSDGTDGATANVAVAKVGGGTRTLNFKNGLYIDYTDS